MSRGTVSPVALLLSTIWSLEDPLLDTVTTGVRHVSERGSSERDSSIGRGNGQTRTFWTCFDIRIGGHYSKVVLVCRESAEVGAKRAKGIEEEICRRLNTQCMNELGRSLS